MDAGAGIHRSSNPSQVRPPPPSSYSFSLLFSLILSIIYIYICAFSELMNSILVGLILHVFHKF